VRLVVTTPTSVVVEESRVSELRAEDETGAFGIRPGHADFLTVLAVSVISWRCDGASRHVAVRGGVLTVRDGQEVSVATREAIGGETLERLGDAVLERFRREATAESESRISTTRLHLATMRQIFRYLESDRQTRPVGGPPNLSPAGDGPGDGGGV
jgi:F-type H+-transporting ATPase subunit epsilon